MSLIVCAILVIVIAVSLFWVVRGKDLESEIDTLDLDARQEVDAVKADAMQAARDIELKL